MKKIVSRQNPLVAAFRAVARGERPGLLLDGAHLVVEALASRVAMTQAMVTPEGRVSRRRTIQPLLSLALPTRRDFPAA